MAEQALLCNENHLLLEAWDDVAQYLPTLAEMC